jgi:anti-sigma factor RsiW
MCLDVRSDLPAFQRGRVSPERETAIRRHLADCASCARAAEAERLLTEALESTLPQYPASLALKRRLEANWRTAEVSGPTRWQRWRPWLAPVAVTALLLFFVFPTAYQSTRSGRPGTAAMVQEAANDYIRLLASQQPLEIASGGLHQVKPWFAGRLDFAPVVGFEGDAEFPLKGGAIGYYLDRRAAVFVYGRRLHTIALFVFRADGLPWPTRDLEPLGLAQAHVTQSKGFHVILWRTGELGYALVSDVDGKELINLGARIAGSS